MPRRTLGIMLLLAAVSLSAGTAWAGDQPRPRRRAKDRVEAILGRIDEALDLDNEKLVQIEQILRTQWQAVRNWQSEHADELKANQGAYAAARKARDRDKLRALAAKRRELQAGMKEVREALPKALGDVLTEEQVKKIMPLLNPQQDRRRGTDSLARILGALGRLRLTREQRAAVGKIMAEHKQAMAKADSPEAKAKLTAATVKKIMAVLTEAQRKALAAMKDRRSPSRNPLAGLDLSEKQQGAIKKVNEDFTAAMKAAKTPEARRAAVRARWEKTQGVLTKEQLDKWRQQMRERQRRRRGDGERGRGSRDRSRRDSGGGRPRPE